MLGSVRGDIKVEDIVSVADVSRATFYLHFASIDEALTAVRADMTARLDAQYDQLAAMENPDISDVRAWLAAMLAMCRRHRPTVLALMRASSLPGATFNARAYYDGVIARLAGAQAGFASARTDSEARAEALLILIQIEGMIRYFVAAQGGNEEEAMVERIAEAIVRFVAR